MNTLRASQRNKKESIHNLEKKIGQLVKLVFERAIVTFPSNTEVTPTLSSNSKDRLFCITHTNHDVSLSS